MSPLNIPEEEKKSILEKHKQAMKDFYQKKADMKNGLKAPEKPKEEKPKDSK